MARLTVEQIMQSIAATVNQEASAPTDGSAEYNLWLEYMNRGINEWADAHDWEELRNYYYPAVTGTSQATVAMPDDFKKLAASPRLHNIGSATEGEEYADIPVEKRGLYNTTDKYVYQLGNMDEGYSYIFHPGTLCSGASIEFQYYSTPTSLASPAQIPQIPDSQFLIDRTVGYIFEARSDPRFQQAESKSREKLLQMIENSNLAKFSSHGTPDYVMTAPLRKTGFRIGRD